MAGILMKARSQIFRVSAIVSCLREALSEVPFPYTVIPDDIRIAYSIIQVSLKIHEVLAEAMSAIFQVAPVNESQVQLRLSSNYSIHSFSTFRAPSC